MNDRYEGINLLDTYTNLDICFRFFAISLYIPLAVCCSTISTLVWHVISIITVLSPLLLQEVYFFPFLTVHSFCDIYFVFVPSNNFATLTEKRDMDRNHLKRQVDFMKRSLLDQVLLLVLVLLSLFALQIFFFFLNAVYIVRPKSAYFVFDFLFSFFIRIMVFTKQKML